MRKATHRDKPIVVDIISRAFDTNPGVNWLIKKSGSRQQKIRALARYAFSKCLPHHGVLISSNEKGVALCYRYDEHRFSLKAFFYELWFALTAIGLGRLPKVLKREAHRAYLRPASGAYYYFWFLAVVPEGRGAGFELKEAVLQQAAKDHLPVYLETSVERNKTIYEHIGFTTYHYWEDSAEDIRFWFMKWEPMPMGCPVVKPA